MTDNSTSQPSASEHDHSQCIRNALSAAEQVCAQRGVQLTPIRHKILELIWNSHQAIKAYDLLDQIRPSNDAAKPSTVYRALDFLLEHGLIHRVESLNAFVGCRCSGSQHDQLLLICTACHNVEERAASNVFLALADEMHDASFSPLRKTVEIHGLCKSCQSRSKP
ncbi:MAG: transcriptional repressor [Methylomonas sp.]|nr:transcriptional repressor [Methylomonas sp.]